MSGFFQDFLPTFYQDEQSMYEDVPREANVILRYIEIYPVTDCYTELYRVIPILVCTESKVYTELYSV